MRIENSFIPVSGVGERTECRLWEAGVTHWSEFHDAGNPRGVGTTTADRIESFIAEAGARLDDNDSAYFDRQFPDGERWRLYENFAESTCFFDIETTGLDARRSQVTTVSFHQDSETTTLVAGDDLTAEAVREEFASAKLLATFNGRRFDVPFLEESLDMDITTPHLDLMYPCRRVGLSGGLKPIEKELGIDRDRPDLSGRDAIRLWRKYQRGDEGALETLVSYNRDDTVNLQRLADTVSEALHADVFEPVAGSQPTD